MSLTADSSLPLQLETTDRRKSVFAKHFKNQGKKIADSMKDRYGNKPGQQVFNATAAKAGMAADDEQPKRKSFGQRIAEKGC